MKRYYFQVNTRVIYDIELVEAPSYEEALALYKDNQGRVVCRDFREDNSDLGGFMGENALSPEQYDSVEA